MDVDALRDAAASALSPPGRRQWFVRPLTDGIEFRAVVKNWVDAPAEGARETRVACGAALCAARLCLAVQGWEPVVTPLGGTASLATLRVGAPAAPRREDRLLYRALHEDRFEVAPVAADVLRTVVRRAADVRRVWLSTVPGPVPAVGRVWGDGEDSAGEGVIAVIGAPATDRIADLRVGDAVQYLRLVAVTLGWDVRVLAGPVPREQSLHFVGSDVPTGSVVLFRVLPAAARTPVPEQRGRPVRGGAGSHRVPGR